ncbi:TatD family hydrolase [Chloroflexota bacterium]
MLSLVDTHAHLDEIEDVAAALAEAQAAGVTAIVAVGQDMASNRKVLELAAAYPVNVLPALGYHPWNIRRETIDATLAFIEDNAEAAVAVGEIGLDYHKRVRAVAEKDLQKEVLRDLLDIAKRKGKTVSLHTRYAWRDALELVQASGVPNAVFHWYTGPSSVLRDIISGGYYLSITPAVTYHEEHRRAAKEAPLSRLLLETDAPVVYGRGREHEFTAQPKDVTKVLTALSVLKKTDASTLAVTTTESAFRLFRQKNTG